MSKVKVLHLLSSNKYSGAENVACNIIAIFKDEAQMVYCSPKGPIETALKRRNIKYISINKLSIGNVKKVIKDFRPDIIYAHDFKASCIAALCSKKIKTISHIHCKNSIIGKRNIKSFLYKLLTKKFSKIIWVSQSAYDECYFSKKIEAKSIILYNIIIKDEIIEKSKEDNIKNTFDLLFLGRLTHQKNPERLIQLMEMIKKKKKDIKLAIVGDGEKRDVLEKMVEEYKLSKNVCFFGFQGNPFPIMSKCKILIMTSFYEGTPMAALEAQCLGLPIISTPVDGLKDIIINDYNGYLSDDNDIISNKIVEILNDEKELTQLQCNSKKRFNDINDIKKYKEKLLSFLEIKK